VRGLRPASPQPALLPDNPSSYQPQQFWRPKAVSLDSTPDCGWSVMSVTPVSTKVLPAVAWGLVPSFAKAATPSCAIFSGYCCDVAPSWPALTAWTPGHPPSTETIVTDLSLPAALSDW